MSLKRLLLAIYGSPTRYLSLSDLRFGVIVAKPTLLLKLAVTPPEVVCIIPRWTTEATITWF
jgi:hypothetical protein